LLTIPAYKSGQHEFTALFHFGTSSNKLEKVVLQSNAPTYLQKISLTDLLRAKYGDDRKTESNSRYGNEFSYSTHEWMSDGTQIRMFVRGSYPVIDLQITYSPRIGEGNKGL
jgi:hypothetical protein